MSSNLPTSPRAASSAASNSASGVSFSSSSRTSILSSLRSQSNNSYVKITIRDNEFHSETPTRSSSTFSSDFDSLASQIKADIPCFFLFFKTTGSQTNPLVVTWNPESASVKDRMVYSSSKGAIYSLLADGGFPSSKVDNYHASTLAELKYSKFNEGKSFDRTTVMSEIEVEEAKLVKSLPKSDLKKSAGYGLLAQISGKGLPPKLAQYGFGNSEEKPASGSGDQGFQRVYGKPSQTAGAKSVASPKAATPISAVQFPPANSASSTKPSNTSNSSANSNSTSSSFASLRPTAAAPAADAAPKVSIAALMKNFSVDQAKPAEKAPVSVTIKSTPTPIANSAAAIVKEVEVKSVEAEPEAQPQEIETNQEVYEENNNQIESEPVEYTEAFQPSSEPVQADEPTELAEPENNFEAESEPEMPSAPSAIEDMAAAAEENNDYNSD